MELFDNWGSHGTIFIDGTALTGEINFQGLPPNSRVPDTTFTEGVFSVNNIITVIELRVVDITNRSEIYIDNLKIATSGSAFGGSVTGMTPADVLCWNLTTGESVSFQTSSVVWDCEAAGLVVNSGDRVFTGAEGIAE